MSNVEGRLQGRRLLAALLLAFIGLAGLIGLIRIGLAERAVDAHNGVAAVRLRSSNSQALSQAAQEAYRDGSLPKAAKLARRSLVASPINVQATRVLAQAMNVSDPEASTRLMLIAGKMGWRDQLTQVWLIQQAVATRNATIAVERAEALVRLNKERDIVAMLLRLLASDRRARATMVAALAKDPVWRGAFLVHQENIPTSQLPGLLALLSDLRRSAIPPRAEEARATIQSSVNAGQVTDAWRLHRELFENGKSVLVSNGGFERQDVGYEVNSSASALDWMLLTPGRSSAALQTGPNRQGHVLAATAAGNLEGRVAEQTILLVPGSYELAYRMQSEDPAAPEQIRWSIRCTSGAPILFQTPPIRLKSTAWTSLKFPFAVHGECPAQILELRADPHLGGRAVDALFDNVTLRKVG